MSMGGNIYKIQPYKGKGMCLEAVTSTSLDASGFNAKNVDIGADKGASAQRWAAVANDDGTYALVPQSATGQALDVNFSGSTDGTLVHLFMHHGGRSERWTIAAVMSEDEPPVSYHVYSLDAASVAKDWSQATNGGAVLCSGNTLELHGRHNGYPVLQTIENPFPSAGDWTFCVSYRYTKSATFGTEIKCESGGKDVVFVHQDNNGQFIDVADHGVWHAPANLDEHVLSVSKVGSDFIVAVDAQRVATVPVTVQPTSIRLGGTKLNWRVDSLDDWNDLVIDDLRVTTTTGTNAPKGEHANPSASDRPVNFFPPHSQTSFPPSNSPNLSKTERERAKNEFAKKDALIAELQSEIDQKDGELSYLKSLVKAVQFTKHSSTFQNVQPPAAPNPSPPRTEREKVKQEFAKKDAKIAALQEEVNARDEDIVQLKAVARQMAVASALPSPSRKASATSALPVPRISRELATTEIADIALPAVVSIAASDGTGSVSMGSGFVIAKGFITTNYHVVKGARDVTVKFSDGRSVSSPGYIAVSKDSQYDLAIISCDTGAVRPLSLAESSAVRIGESVVAVGSPQGLNGSISTGIVSGIRKISDIFPDLDLSNATVFQTTAPISHGSSGGPLIDTHGNVIGMNTLSLSFVTSGQNLNFAFASDYVRALYSSASSQQVNSWATDLVAGAVDSHQPATTIASPPPASDTDPATVLTRSAQDAIASGLITFDFYNVMLYGGRITSLCVAISNRSNTPVTFWTTVRIIDSYHSYSEVLTYMISRRAIPDPETWTQQVIAGAIGRGGSFTHHYPVASPTSQSDTLINPGGVLHVFCTLPRPMLYGQFTMLFQGGGWDGGIQYTPQ